jgi:hypothetical protein
MENKFEFSATVKSFAELNPLVRRKIDCIIHTGVSHCNDVELKNLAIEYKNNLTKYLDGEDEIYYFRFGKKEHYEYLPLGIPISKLRETANGLINPPKLTSNDINKILEDGIIALSKIHPIYKEI